MLLLSARHSCAMRQPWRKYSSALQAAMHQHTAADCRNHTLSLMSHSPAVLRHSGMPWRLRTSRLVCTAAIVQICCHSRCSSYARQPAPAAMLLHRMLAQVGYSSAELALPYCSVMHRGDLSVCASTFFKPLLLREDNFLGVSQQQQSTGATSSTLMASCRHTCGYLFSGQQQLHKWMR